MKITKIIFILLAIIWIGISSYLTYTHFSEVSIVCAPNESTSFIINNSGWNNCDSTLNSKYSEFFGIPVSILWIFFYLTSLIVFVLFWYKNYFSSSLLNKYFKEILLFITSTWLLVSIFFSYLQLFVINSFCVYCFTSAFITLLLFWISLYIKLINKN